VLSHAASFISSPSAFFLFAISVPFFDSYREIYSCRSCWFSLLFAAILSDSGQISTQQQQAPTFLPHCVNLVAPSLFRVGSLCLAVTYVPDSLWRLSFVRAICSLNFVRRTPRSTRNDGSS